MSDDRLIVVSAWESYGGGMSDCLSPAADGANDPRLLESACTSPPGEGMNEERLLVTEGVLLVTDGVLLVTSGVLLFTPGDGISGSLSPTDAQSPSISTLVSSEVSRNFPVDGLLSVCFPLLSSLGTPACINLASFLWV